MGLRKAAALLCVSAFLITALLTGCAEEPFMLDGPGMVNDQPWSAFKLSRSGSYVQHNFWFEVEMRDEGFFLTGECVNKKGKDCVLEKGAKISEDDMQYLRSLWLGDLEDVSEDGTNGLTEEELQSIEEGVLLDGTDVTFILTWIDGTEQEKNMSSEMAVEIYDRFLPYFN